MAPFAVLAPLVGPVVDRLRGTRRLLSSAPTCAARRLRDQPSRSPCTTSAFYVLALAMLITSKASGVIRQALVPRLVDDPDLLGVGQREHRPPRHDRRRRGRRARGAHPRQPVGRWLLAFAAIDLRHRARSSAWRIRTAREHEVDRRGRVHPAALCRRSSTPRAGACSHVARSATSCSCWPSRCGDPASRRVVYGAAVFLCGLWHLPRQRRSRPAARRFHEERLLAGSLLRRRSPTAIGLLGGVAAVDHDDRPGRRRVGDASPGSASTACCSAAPRR